jgi:hypothetical protein
MTVSKRDYDSLHEKVDGIAESVSRIEGRLDQTKTDWSIIGVISAIALGLWNLIK